MLYFGSISPRRSRFHFDTLLRSTSAPTDRPPIYMLDHRRPTILFYAIGIQRTEEEEEAAEEEEEDGAGGFGL